MNQFRRLAIPDVVEVVPPRFGDHRGFFSEVFKQSAFEDGAGYFTVIGYGAMHGIKIDHATAIRVGRRAGELSKRDGIPVGKVRDVRFGQVNSYHESMLDAAFIEMRGGK